jgi:response regulator RpfG family c-di-GMP phosphodiesterase
MGRQLNRRAAEHPIGAIPEAFVPFSSTGLTVLPKRAWGNPFHAVAAATDDQESERMSSFFGVPGATPERPPILLVDDAVPVLDGLRRQLRKNFTVHTATGGAEALRLLESEPVRVVVSDMRMPGMDGATFLSRVRERWADVGRILLTGEADTRAAAAAVDDGRIHRFLTKPCPPEVLVAEINGAVELNRPVTAEQELQRRTARGTAVNEPLVHRLENNAGGATSPARSA